MTDAILIASQVLTLIWGVMTLSQTVTPSPVVAQVQAEAGASCLGAWSGSYQHGPHVGTADLDLVAVGEGVSGSGWVDTPGGRLRALLVGRLEGERLTADVSVPGWSAPLDVRCTPLRLSGSLGSGSVDLRRP